jgi:hypothetical protein
MKISSLLIEKINEQNEKFRLFFGVQILLVAIQVLGKPLGFIPCNLVDIQF